MELPKSTKSVGVFFLELHNKEEDNNNNNEMFKMQKPYEISTSWPMYITRRLMQGERKKKKAFQFDSYKYKCTHLLYRKGKHTQSLRTVSNCD